MKPKAIDKWLICLIVLILVQMACVNNVSPKLQKIQQPIFDFFNGFANFARSLGLGSSYHPAPIILEVTYADPNSMSPTIKGRVNSNVSNFSILRLYTMKLMGCDGPYAKYALVDEYPVMDILISPDQFEWIIENAPINEGEFFGVTLVGLSYDKTAVIETGMSNIWMNQTRTIELSADPVDPLIRSGMISVSGGAEVENMCLTLERNGLVENQTAVSGDGKWLFENVMIAPGVNEFVIGTKQNYLANFTNTTITVNGYEITLDWPIGEMENGIYKPAFKQGRITSWYGWNNWHVKNGNGFHTGIDIAPANMTAPYLVRAAADGEIYLIKDLPCQGNTVGIDHGAWGTSYLHLKSFDTNIKIGGEVKAGDPIGVMGGTGRCSEGVHLHLSAFTWSKGALKNTLCQKETCNERVGYININPVSDSVPLNKNGVAYDLKTCIPDFDVWRFNWRTAGVDIDSSYFNLTTSPMHPTKDTVACSK